MSLIKKKRKLDKKLLFCLALSVFPIVQFCVFYIGVNFQSFMLSFQKYDGLNARFYFLKEDVFQNFKRIFEDVPTLMGWFKNSLIVWFFTAFAGTVLAVLFSYYVFKRKKTGKIFKFILFIPSVLPAILLSSVFQNLVNEFIPLVSKVEESYLTASAVGANPNVVLTIVVLYTVWVGFGPQVLMYTGSLAQISPEVLEASHLDGANSLQEFWYVILPSIMPTVGTFIVVGIALIFTNQANMYNFFGNNKNIQDIQTIGYYLFRMTNDVKPQANYPYLSAFGLVCSLVAILPTVLLRKYFSRFEG